MKRLLLVAFLGLAGYYAYEWVSQEPAAPAPVPSAAPVKKKPVDFAMRSRVNKLFQEWKRQQLITDKGQQGLATCNPEEELNQIRQHLFREGRHSESAVADLVSQCLQEMGLAEEEIGSVSSSLVSLRSAN